MNIEELFEGSFSDSKTGKLLFNKKCCICGKDFESERANKNICSFECKKEHNRQHSLFYTRIKRQKKTGGRPCYVCGFSETVDLHREGTEVYILCPNHHCLITRGVKTLQQVLASKTV